MRIAHRLPRAVTGIASDLVPSKFTALALLALVAASAAGCVFGPGQLKRGHVAYNRAVKSASDEEILLNIVRMRYADTIDFVATTSISSQLVMSVSAGVSGGKSLDSNGTGVIGSGEMGYSTRPTFTFTPQRGREFARQLIEPVDVDVLAYLIASDWDVRMLFRLLVRSLNGVDNELGLPSPEFADLTERLAEMQAGNHVFTGFVHTATPVSDPIATARVSGTDLVEAAKSGFEFRSTKGGGAYVLTTQQAQPVLAFDEDSPHSEHVRRLLRLTPGKPYYSLVSGTRVDDEPGELDVLSVRTGSLLRAIIYLSQGVQVPPEDVEKGHTTATWPPGTQGLTIQDIFDVRVAKREPDAQLTVYHRGHWFYIDDADIATRYTFFHIAELSRLGLARAEGQGAPVLTLPVGG